MRIFVVGPRPTVWAPWLLVLGASLLFLEAFLRSGDKAAGSFPAAVALVLLVAAGSRRPVAMVCILAVLVPLQVTLLSLIHAAGVPAGIVRGMGFIKEAAVVALAMAAFRYPVDRRSPVKSIAGGYVLLGSLFFLLPLLAPGVLYDVPLAPRLLGWRSEFLGIVGLLALASMRLPRESVAKVEKCVVGTGVVLALGALWEVTNPGSFDAVTTGFIRVAQYRNDVLGGHDQVGASRLVHTTSGGLMSIRAGSFLYNPLALSFYLLIPFSLVAARLSRLFRPRDAVVLTVLALGLLATQTRSSLLAAVAAVIFLAARSQGAQRVRVLGAALVVGSLLLSGFGSAVLGRFSDASKGVDVSTQQHKAITTAAFYDVVANPLGRGLGSSPGIGSVYGVQGAVDSENAFLQVGVEMGVVGMLLFSATLFGSIVLGASTRYLGLGAAGAALAVSGMFLHTWEEFGVSLTYWCLAGLILATDWAEPALQEVAAVDALV